ncbi:hypothetical protein F5Y06DRAFT_285781 [Hypoxylon sp. FL0890]|nr:hypothetical protein F5Y06DRAFT_285781 [Hypoxylon sp. FL0890]
MAFRCSWEAWGERSSLRAIYSRYLMRRYLSLFLSLLFIIVILVATPFPGPPVGGNQPTPTAMSSLSMILAPVVPTKQPVEASAFPVGGAKLHSEFQFPFTPIGQSPVAKSHHETIDPDYCTTWPVNTDGTYTPNAKPEHPMVLDTLAPEGGWKKPRGFKVVAMVFYKHRRNADLLDCYLRQNLAVYGGYLDEVWFMVHTIKRSDIEWLRGFVNEMPEYKFVDLGPCAIEKTKCLWEHAVDDDTLYIKMDDNVLYIHHDAIPQLVHTRLAQPHPYAISAQIVNSPVTGLQQLHYGAIHAFLPAPSRGAHHKAAETWRPSEMGLYPEGTLRFSQDPINLNSSSRGHTWLLLSNSSHDTLALTRTPMGAWNHHLNSETVTFGPHWKSWGLSAQQLYSLLYNLELNQMHRYHFGRAIDFEDHANHKDPCTRATTTPSNAHANPTTHASPSPGGEQLYDTQYEPYHLKFIAIWGRDIAASLPVRGSDETHLTSSTPLRLGRPFVIDTRAVVGHESFGLGDGVAYTDLVDRFRSYANEMVCAPDNVKKPWDGRCSGF